MAFKILLFTAIFSCSIQASLERFCSDRSSDLNFIQDSLKLRENQLSFQNTGGLIGGGVCWWHSRFTRNMSYLAYFSPYKPKLKDHQKIKKLILNIKKGKSLVEIPGFRNTYGFSKAYQNEIQSVLNQWQIEDGFIRQAWIIGLAGRSERKSIHLQKTMERTFSQINDGRVVYHKLQIKGITAHAWLVVDMEEVNNGYDLEVLDSNRRQTLIYSYRFGDTFFTDKSYGNFSPYLEFSKEEERLNQTLSYYCKED